MARWHSYTGPFWDEGNDYPHLELNLYLGEKPKPTKWPETEPDVHWAAVQIVREELIAEMLALCAICGIPEHQIKNCPPYVLGTRRPLRDEQPPATVGT